MEGLKRYEALRLLITPGFTDTNLSKERTAGVCIHHSFLPTIPDPGENYAEIFHKYHFHNNQWQNGLGYDFVVTWHIENDSPITEYWTSARWILQLSGAHSLNPKGKKWTSGNIIIPNRELMSICVVGDFDLIDFPEYLYGFLADIIQKSGVEGNVFCHREFDYKSCPGSSFKKDELIKLL